MISSISKFFPLHIVRLERKPGLYEFYAYNAARVVLTALKAQKQDQLLNREKGQTLS